VLLLFDAYVVGWVDSLECLNYSRVDLLCLF